MKTFKIIFALGASMLTLNANEIKIDVENIDVSRGGNLIVMIFQKDGFPKKHDKAILKETKKVNAKSMTFSFETDLDELAIKILHDENEDGQVTKDWTGIFPKDGLGFSNKQTILNNLGVPTYEKCKLDKEAYENNISIELIYGILEETS